MLTNTKSASGGTKLKKGFTLIELVVVMAIIAVLAALMVAALSAARKQATNTQRMGNLKAVEAALETRSAKCGGNYFAASTTPACTAMTAASITTASGISTALAGATGANALTSSVIDSADDTYYSVTASSAGNSYTIIAYDKVTTDTTKTALYTATR